MTPDRQRHMMLLIAAGLVALGSILPWATAGPFSVNGTSGDGMITIGIGLSVGVWGLLSDRPPFPLVAMIALAIAGLIGIYDTLQIEAPASVGVGLYMVMAGGGLAVLAVLIRGSSRSTFEPRHPLPPPTPDQPHF